MNKKGKQNNFMVILVLVMVLFLGLALLNPVANTQADSSQKQVIANETRSLTSCYTPQKQVNTSISACNLTVNGWYPTGDWRIDDSQCNLGSVTIKNGTGTLLTVNVDYRVFSNTGIIQMLNTTATSSFSGNVTFLSYDYCSTKYLQNSSDRSLISLNSLLMIIALVIMVVAVVRKMWLDN